MSQLAPSTSNHAVGEILSEIAQLLELKAESAFRIRAYENAARTIQHLSADIAEEVRHGRVREIAGIGDALALKISEYVETGEMAYLTKLRGEFPDGVRALMGVPGVGPKMAARAYRELQVETLDDLEEAARDGRLAGLSRLGEKTATNIIRAIERFRSQDSARIPIG